MEYHNLVIDFAERTEKNLEFVREALIADEDADVFEVTQLTNSLLGLMVFPQQRFFQQISRTPLEDLTRDGWTLPSNSGRYCPATDLHELLRHMRNSLTHCNIKFLDNDGVITGLKMWDRRNRNSPIDWEAELTIDELDAFITKFIQLIKEIDPADE